MAIALLGIALACGSNPVVVAKIEVDAGHMPCTVSDAGDDPCQVTEPGTFCSLSCGTKAGFCEPLEADGCPSSDPDPECGCNGISYFNKCRREEARVGLSATGQCLATAVPCTKSGEGGGCPSDNDSCAFVFPFRLPQVPAPDAGPGAVCAVLPAAFSAIGGTCWALPETCPSSDSQQVIGLCGTQCIPECSAIRDGGIYFPCPFTADAAAE